MNKQRNCGNCMYWHGSYKVSEKGFSDCGAIGIYDGPYKDEPAYIQANAADDTGLDAILFTHKDFVCPMHRFKREAKW